MSEPINTVVIGGGQAGLSVSYFLKQFHHDHVVLEKNRIASSWRQRWDSFTLVTPNLMNRLPGFPAAGDPDIFLTRDQVVDYLERFADSFEPPLREGVHVAAVTPTGNREFLVETSHERYRTANVVVATGTFQKPRIPPAAAGLPGDLTQIHSSQYRKADQLPAGAVLVVGSGQSGAQITEDLLLTGRRVYLSVSRAGRIPRRYRGRDTLDWAQSVGLFERTVDQLPSPGHRFGPHPHASGRDGGRTLNLRRLGREGATLLGKVAGAEDGLVFLTGDLSDNLRKADAFAAQICKEIDTAVQNAGLPFPELTAEDLQVETWEPPENIRQLDLTTAGIESVVWATGYGFDFSWVKADIFDDFGYPVQQQGVSDWPGLYFAGLHWLHKWKSGLLYGVAEDAEKVARHIVGRPR